MKDFLTIITLYIHIDQLQINNKLQSTLYAHELSCYFLRILSIFRGKLHYLRLATAPLDINVEPLKENGILLSQFAQNVVEVSF